ncbi:hypothetical protein T492DRAFT_851115 [Pavlovales sp. CCMP2436]|nr:hypothetical protein T492DRAFT_851115 [Pavlovales sp. CCMP2436]
MSSQTTIGAVPDEFTCGNPVHNDCHINSRYFGKALSTLLEAELSNTGGVSFCPFLHLGKLNGQRSRLASSRARTAAGGRKEAAWELAAALGRAHNTPNPSAGPRRSALGRLAERLAACPVGTPAGLAAKVERKRPRYWRTEEPEAEAFKGLHLELEASESMQLDEEAGAPTWEDVLARAEFHTPAAARRQRQRPRRAADGRESDDVSSLENWEKGL